MLLACWSYTFHIPVICLPCNSPIYRYTSMILLAHLHIYSHVAPNILPHTSHVPPMHIPCTCHTPPIYLRCASDLFLLADHIPVIWHPYVPHVHHHGLPYSSHIPAIWLWSFLICILFGCQPPSIIFHMLPICLPCPPHILLTYLPSASDTSLHASHILPTYLPHTSHIPST